MDISRLSRSLPAATLAAGLLVFVIVGLPASASPDPPEKIQVSTPGKMTGFAASTDKCVIAKQDHLKPVHPSHIQRADTTDTTQWDPPRIIERKEERHEMVRNQIIRRGIQDSAVIAAMRAVPRHLFVPSNRRGTAYEDRPLPIGHGQTISQPYIVAFMTEALDVNPDDKVLEIGTGSGYQGAVLSELTPHVYTIEIIEALGRQARKKFNQLGYSTIHVRIGDGYHGWKEYAPFDGIIVTAAAPEIPKPLIEQLKPGGTLIMPTGSTYGVQKLVRIRKTADGKIRKDTLMSVRFVPMKGEIRK